MDAQSLAHVRESWCGPPGSRIFRLETHQKQRFEHSHTTKALPFYYLIALENYIVVFSPLALQRGSRGFSLKAPHRGEFCCHCALSTVTNFFYRPLWADENPMTCFAPLEGQND